MRGQQGQYVWTTVSHSDQIDIPVIASLGFDILGHLVAAHWPAHNRPLAIQMPPRPSETGPANAPLHHQPPRGHIRSTRPALDRPSFGRIDQKIPEFLPRIAHALAAQPKPHQPFLLSTHRLRLLILSFQKRVMPSYSPSCSLKISLTRVWHEFKRWRLRICATVPHGEQTLFAYAHHSHGNRMERRMIRRADRHL